MFSQHFHHIHLFQNLIPFFSTWGYVIILAASFLEGLPVIGFISPGGLAVIIGGFLVKTHVLSLWKVLFFSIIGAFLGDFLAYAIGRIYGHKFLLNYGRYFFLKEEHIEKTRKLLQDHTGKSIIIGRFNYLTRSLSPFLSGASGIGLVKFLSFGFISAGLWAVFHFLIGFVAGRGYEVASHYINLILLIAIVLSILIFYGYRFVNRRHHVFKKYHVYTLVLNIISLYLFAKILEDVVNREWLYHVDQFINHFIPTIWNPVVIQIMIVVSDLLTPLNVFIFSCLFIGYLLHRREYYYSVLSLFALIFGLLSEYFLKLILGFPRPLEPLLAVSNFSFPSGHATTITIFGLLVFHCLRKDLKTRRQKLWLLIGAGLLILLVGFSRIYLNVHWFSDVIGGYTLGVFSVTFAILFVRAATISGRKLVKIGRAFFWPLIQEKNEKKISKIKGDDTIDP